MKLKSMIDESSSRCKKCSSQLTYLEPIRKLPWKLGEFFWWSGAALCVGAVSVLGGADYGIAFVVGGIIGVIAFLKLGYDTKNDPAQGLLYCKVCKSYSKSGKN